MDKQSPDRDTDAPPYLALQSRLRDRATALRAEFSEVDRDRTETLAAAHDAVEDAGDEAEDRRSEEVRLAEEARDVAELRDIEAALARLDDGTYGQCTDCGTAIPLARLQAQPTAIRCVACQDRFEKAA